MFYRISDPYVNRICDAVCRSVRESARARRPRPGRAATAVARARRRPAARRRAGDGMADRG